jgi:nitroreductase
MDLETAIATRRTHKQYGPDPIDRETIVELLDLARWAPNHHLTQPWRFRVLGPDALARLKEAAGEKEAAKLGRAPTLVLATAALSEDPIEAEEDLLATGCAVYVVLLAAHARGLASYWRTPGILRTREGRAALEVADDEHVVGLIHLGTPVSDPPRKEREAPRVEFLD